MGSKVHGGTEPSLSLSSHGGAPEKFRSEPVGESRTPRVRKATQSTSQAGCAEASRWSLIKLCQEHFNGLEEPISGVP